MTENDCYGCEHPDLHGCAAPVERCYKYCTSCGIDLTADYIEGSAQWYLWRLKDIADVNLMLLVDSWRAPFRLMTPIGRPSPRIASSARETRAVSRLRAWPSVVEPLAPPPRGCG